MKDKITRRDFIKSAVGAVVAINSFSAIKTEANNEKFDLAVVKSSSPETGTIKAIEIMGGIGNYIKSGDVVIIKPNMAFPNPPIWGSTTNPEVVIAVVKLCLDAGAKSIIIADHPMARPDQCLQRTGIAEACKNLGSDKVKVSMQIEQRAYTEVRLEKAKALEKTEVLKLLLKADVFINIPVAKSHSATSVSFGIKNLMGLIWDRAYLHQNIDLHQGIADLCTFIKPSLIVMDGTNALITKGPEGPGTTIKPNAIIVGTDQVSVDSYTLSLSSWNGRSLSPSDIRHISLANEMKMGEMNLDKLNIKKIEI